MFRTALPPVLASGLAACLVLATPLAAQAQLQTQPQPTLSLSATAQINIAPEYASVRSGVVVVADSAQDAVARNGAMMSAVFSALRRRDIAEADMQTSNLSVRPVYSSQRYDNEAERRIIGYEARNTVAAKVRDLTEVGEIIDAMVSAGANNIESVTFGAEDTADAMDEARRMAVGRLVEKADLFASAAGLELCGIRRLSESGGRPQYANAVATRSFAEDSSTPIAAGTLTLSASVSADFCIDAAEQGSGE